MNTKQIVALFFIPTLILVGYTTGGRYLPLPDRTYQPVSDSITATGEGASAIDMAVVIANDVNQQRLNCTDTAGKDAATLAIRMMRCTPMD